MNEGIKQSKKSVEPASMVQWFNGSMVQWFNGSMGTNNINVYCNIISVF